jgi:septal ring factor EnvC (AmiA/AmiB activator)
MKTTLKPTMDEQQYIKAVMQQETYEHEAKKKRLLSCIDNVKTYTEQLQQKLEDLGNETERVRKCMVHRRERAKHLESYIS